MIGIGIADSLGVNLSGLNPATKSFITSAGISDAGTVTTINNLVNGLQASGLWSKMKAVYPFVTDNRNLLSYSQDFSNGTWIKSESSITANSATAPDGTNTATKLIWNNAATSNGQVFQSLMDRGTASNPIIQYTLVGSGTATVLSGSPTTYGITSVGNGWYRCYMKDDNSTQLLSTYAKAGEFNRIILQIYSSNKAIYVRDSIATQGNGTSGVYIWGAQLELGSTATTYQPIATTQQAYIASQFKYNLKDPRDLDAAFRLVFNGGWTHSSTGATPNGTNGYADTKFNQSTNFSATTRHMSYYNRTNTAKGYDMGCQLSVNDTMLASRYTGTSSAYTSFGTSVGGYTLAATAAATGLIQGSNIASDERLYKNGISIATKTRAISNVNLPIFLSAANFNTVAIEFTDHQCAFSSIGDGLTDTEATNLYTRVQAFQTSLNRQIP